MAKQSKTRSISKDALEFLSFNIFGGFESNIYKAFELDRFDAHQKTILKYVQAILTDKCTPDFKDGLIEEFIATANYRVSPFAVDFDLQAEALLSVDSKFNSIETILLQYLLLEFKQKKLQPHYAAAIRNFRGGVSL